MLPILFFGMIVGLLLHWMQPNNRGIGYFGAAVLGTAGTFFGSIFAIAVADSLQTGSLVILSMLLMGAGIVIMLISQKVAQLR